MITEYENTGPGLAIRHFRNGKIFWILPGSLNNFSINRLDRVIRLDATYLRVAGLVHSRYIQVPGLGISTLNPFAKLRAGIERGTLNGLPSSQNLIAPSL